MTHGISFTERCAGCSLRFALCSLGALALLLALALGGVNAAAQPTLNEQTAFSPADRKLNPGGLKMYTYVPESVKTATEPRPLVVLLHGCGQRASDYFLPTGWPQLAEQWRFALLLPEQQKTELHFNFMAVTGNPAYCFTWYEADRGNPEVTSIMNMIREMVTDPALKLDPRRIFISGLSGGAAMTATMVGLYPACFAGGAPVAGVAFDCAKDSVNQAILDCMHPTDAPGDQPRSSPEEGGRARVSADQWGRWVKRVCETAGDCPAKWPRMSIWQGAQDRMVGPGNLRDLRRQWTNVHGIDEIADQENTIQAAPYEIEHKVYQDDEQEALVETWLIKGTGDGTGHMTPINPDNDPPTELNGEPFACGKAQDYIVDANICSTVRIAKFWGLDEAGDGVASSQHCQRLQ